MIRTCNKQAAFLAFHEKCKITAVKEDQQNGGDTVFVRSDAKIRLINDTGINIIFSLLAAKRFKRAHMGSHCTDKGCIPVIIHAKFHCGALNNRRDFPVVNVTDIRE